MTAAQQVIPVTPLAYNRQAQSSAVEIRPERSFKLKEEQMENNEKKICPLMSINGGHDYCEKDGCAWWLDKEGGCAIAVLAYYKSIEGYAK